VFKGLIWKSGY